MTRMAMALLGKHITLLQNWGGKGTPAPEPRIGGEAEHGEIHDAEAQLSAGFSKTLTKSEKFQTRCLFQETVLYNMSCKL